MSFHFKNPSYHNRSHGTDGTGDQPQSNSSDNPFSGEEMLEFVHLQRSLSRPTDHYHQPRTQPVHELNPYAPPPRVGHSGPNLGNFLRDPLGTTLNSFSKVTNLVLSPTFQDATDEWISSLQLIRPPGGAVRASPTSPRSPRSPRSRSPSPHPHEWEAEMRHRVEVQLPPPALPAIPCSVPQHRLTPLTTELFEAEFVESSRKQILERVFRGGIHSNELRRRLWPVVLGLTETAEEMDWTDLKCEFDIFNGQWQSFLPSQEARFTAYRERKSLIERDVVRCDRTHPFYAGSTGNLEKLRSLLLTYTMYDFDTGYVQGMSDLASPLLYVWDGDVMKSFWCFVQVMKLIGCNFEMSQSSIKFQLEMLWKLIELTDPCFAQYLVANDSSNCYFAFRWIVCQFKREFMKSKDDEYDDCLLLWESIWCASLLGQINEEEENNKVDEEKKDDDGANNKHDDNQLNSTKLDASRRRSDPESERPKSPKEDTSRHSRQSSVRSTGQGVRPTNFVDKKSEKRLKDAELYTLSICLSIIRRERDLIMANRLDATEILKHFNNLQLNEDLWNILLHASTIWFWLKQDCGEQLFYKQLEEPVPTEAVDDFDLLNETLNEEDYLVINSAAI